MPFNASSTYNSQILLYIRSFALVGLVLATLMGQAIPVADAAGIQAAPPRPNVDGLAATAQAKGKVRLIVGLQLQHVPEAELDGPSAVANQRRAIAASQQGLLQRMANRNVRVAAQFKYVPFLALEADADAVKALAADGAVASVQEDELAAPALQDSVPLIGASATGTFGTGAHTGLGQTVAILDTGVMKTHAFLAGKVVSEACYSSTVAAHSSTAVCAPDTTTPGSGINCPTSIDGCEHGTHVAGIVAGKGANGVTFNGVAKDAKLIAIQVFSKFTGANCGGFPHPDPCVKSYTSDQMKALERVYDLRTTFKISAVNMSLGGGQHTAHCDSDARKPLIDQLAAAGIATVIASGNEGLTNAIGAPACISTAVTVGSTTKGDTISSFSNSASMIDLLAPGSDINSSVIDSTTAFEELSGTSMATPHVAGAWAVMKSKAPRSSVAQVLQALQATGRSITDDRNGIAKKRIQVDTALSRVQGPCVDAQEPNNSAAAAKSFTPGSKQRHAFCAARDQDWVKFRAAANTTYRIDTLNLGAGNDSVLTLLGANGTTVLATNDNATTATRASTIIFNIKTAGTYFVKANHKTGAGNTDYIYDLRIAAVPCVDTFEPNNTATAAKAFPLGRTQRHAFCAAADQDWVSFAARAGTTYTLQTSNLAPTVDTVVSVYNSATATTPLLTDAGSTALASSLSFRPKVTGTYFVKVHNKSGAGSPAYSYDIRIAAPPTCPAGAEPNNTAATANPFTVGCTQRHTIGVVEDSDWVKFTAAAGTTYRIETINLGAQTDTVVSLYAGNGTTLLTSQDFASGGSPEVMHWTAPTAGTYYVEVHQWWNSGAGASFTYDLRISNPCNAYEPDNTQAAAKTFAMGSIETRAFCMANDQDWVKFTATAGTTYRIETTELSRDTDTILGLYVSGATTPIMTDDDGGNGLASLIIFTPTTNGTYFVKANHLTTSEAGPTFTYNLRIKTGSTPGFAPQATRSKPGAPEAPVKAR